MTSLGTLTTRARQALGDADGSRYSSELLTEAVRQALSEYSRAYPQVRTAELVLTTAGREQDLSMLEGLLGVLQVIYPYQPPFGGAPRPAASGQAAHHNYYHYWLAGAARLHLEGGRMPQAGDQMRVDYAAYHQLEGLDGETSSSVRPDHTALLVIGVAGHAAMMRSARITEAHGSRSADSKALWLLGKGKLEEFRSRLRELRKETAPPGAHAGWHGSGWRLDRWDR